MWRYGLVELVALAIPFVIYFAYRNFLLRHKLEEGEEYSPVPFHRLFVVAGTLAVLVFVVSYLFGDKGHPGTYVPAHMENGKLVPGKVVEGEAPQQQKEQDRND